MAEGAEGNQEWTVSASVLVLALAAVYQAGDVSPDLVVDVDVNDEVWLREEPMTEADVDELVASFHDRGCRTLIVRAGCLGLLPYRTDLTYPMGFDADHARANPTSLIPDMERYVAQRSKWNKKYAQVIEAFNPPEAFIKAGHKRGMKVILWLDLFDDGFPATAPSFSKKIPIASGREETARPTSRV